MNTINSISHMLRTPEASKYVGLGKSTLEKLRLTGEGPIYCKLGRVVVYTTDDLENWISARRRRSTSVIGVNASRPDDAAARSENHNDAIYGVKRSNLAASRRSM